MNHYRLLAFNLPPIRDCVDGFKMAWAPDIGRAWLAEVGVRRYPDNMRRPERSQKISSVFFLLAAACTFVYILWVVR